MENFKAASTTNFASATGVTFQKHKACMLVASSSASGFTLDFRGVDQVLNTTHVRIPANDSCYIPARIYGATGPANSSIITFN
jgi:hypothetical protein